MTKTLKIFGDEYKIRKTYDIDDSELVAMSLRFIIYNEDNVFLFHFIDDKINRLKR